MTSLASVASVSPPRAQMDARIAAAVAAGSISSTDQAAFAGVLDTLDSSLAGRGGATKPAEVADKVAAIIDEQVAAGTLTDQQASELAAYFAQGPGVAPPGAAMTTDEAEAVGGIAAASGPRGPRGPAGPPPPAANDEDDDDSAETGLAAATDSNTIDDTLAALEKMIENLRKRLQPNFTYGGSTVVAAAGSLIDSVG